MKIYLFNPETGVYLGEDFADEAPMKQGRDILPPDATTIAPPPVEHGQVLVFNTVAEYWEVRPVGNMSNYMSAKNINRENRFAGRL